ncbi:MAG: hypothetical protein HOC24_06720 [Deltaproteobacteria bacterium]|jgi:hypothetical protein|nr:hypothetical protein [Desulfobacteraceae bacterium]MBT4526229.1 hypothetical protein [Deltaproteobacteria bacterium]MBT6050573.1 hypothetical protein [Candidatus Scalindua sp.]
MKNLLFIAFLLSGCTSFLLSGCVSSSFKSSVEPNAINIGMPESEFVKKYGSFGEKLYYTATEMNSFLWILNTGSKAVWLSGNAFSGGTQTIRHHTMVISFDDNKVSKVSPSYMDGYKKRMKAERYKAIYWLRKSLETCKSYLSNQDRGRYGYIVAEILNSWIYSPDVFKSINQYSNRNNSIFYSSQGESRCNDAFAVFEKLSNELAQRNKQNN